MENHTKIIYLQIYSFIPGLHKLVKNHQDHMSNKVMDTYIKVGEKQLKRGNYQVSLMRRNLIISLTQTQLFLLSVQIKRQAKYLMQVFFKVSFLYCTVWTSVLQNHRPNTFIRFFTIITSLNVSCLVPAGLKCFYL